MQRENEAEALLRAVGDRYAGLARYQDEGHVQRQDEPASVVQFRTRFDRTIGLRFEFIRAGHTHSVVGSMTDPDGLMDALAGPTGVSLGAAQTIPALLLPEASSGAWSILQLRDVHLIAPPRDSTAAGRWTWLAGVGWAGQSYRVAIDPASLLIWRLEDDGVREIRPYRTDYEPQIPGSLPAEDFFGIAPGRL
jgi:hypothetical protein